MGARLGRLLEIVACNSTNTPSRFEIGTLKLCGFLVLVDTCSGELRARFWGARVLSDRLRVEQGLCLRHVVMRRLRSVLSDDCIFEYE